MSWQLSPLHISNTVTTGLISRCFLMPFLSHGRAALVWQRVVSLCHAQVCVDKVIHLYAIFVVCNLGYLNSSVIQMEPRVHLEMEEGCKHLGSQSQILLFSLEFLYCKWYLQSSSPPWFCCMCCTLLVGVFLWFVSSHLCSSLT